nr:hypothetical protein [Caballeronia sp. GACF4]
MGDSREARHPSDPHDQTERWSDEKPSVEVARLVLNVDESIALKRTAAAARLTAHGDAVPLLPIKPTRMELAIIIVLAETYGPALYIDARFVPVIDFIAEHGAVVFVQRVMYGAPPVSDRRADVDVTDFAAENGRLFDAVREARMAFEFLCATWPEVFLAQTQGVLAGLGVRVRLPDAEPIPPLRDVENPSRGVDGTDREGEKYNRGDHDDVDHDNGVDDSDSKEGGHG